MATQGVLPAEIGRLEREIHAHLCQRRGYRAVQAINGVGRTIAAILVADIGDVTRFPTPRHLCSWAGLTPGRRESDGKGHDTDITEHGRRALPGTTMAERRSGFTPPVAATELRGRRRTRCLLGRP
ncbi:MAG TPA: transposase, partial [Jiangellaceae bacterium]|nr:transposase [Jiangellaceae bacterium]